MTDHPSAGATDLGYPRWGQALYVLVPALIGAGLGWALTALVDLLLELSWIPFRGPLSLIDSVPDQIAIPVLIGLGLLAGVIFGLYALHEELTLTVDDHRVRLQRGDADRRLDRTAVADVFLDGKDLVFLSHDSNELARERTDRSAARAVKNKKTEDAADLRTELINLGVVVRDEGGKQYWRLATRPDALDA